MILNLKRKYPKSSYIIGELSINGDKFCDTLEPPADRKLYPAIPPGTYKVVLQASSKFKATRPFLHNVPKRVGIMIHEGNEVKDTMGCILVGNNSVPGMVLNSKATLGNLLFVLKLAAQAGEDITIVIS